MTKNTKEFMRIFNRRLRKCLDLAATHCGHESLVRDMEDECKRLRNLVRDEVDGKAGGK